MGEGLARDGGTAMTSDERVQERVLTDERERFEAWAGPLRPGFDLTWHTGRDGTPMYYDPITHTAWTVWQASAEQATAALSASVIAGALYDFAGYLTTLPETMPVGAKELSTPMVDALSAWAKTRGLVLDEANVGGWHAAIRSGQSAEGMVSVPVGLLQTAGALVNALGKVDIATKSATLRDECFSAYDDLRAMIAAITEGGGK